MRETGSISESMGDGTSSLIKKMLRERAFGCLIGTTSKYNLSLASGPIFLFLLTALHRRKIPLH